MPRKISAQINGNALTLSKLTLFLGSIGEVVGKIDIHPALNTAVAQAIKPGRPLPAKEVAGLVEVLDSTQPALCSRLGYRAFVSIFAVLRLSEPCWAQQRGLCLLSEALHNIELETVDVQSIASSLSNLPSLSRKACIGREIMRPSLNHFCNALVDAGARRWIGLLALALLKDCGENVKLTLKESEQDRYMLGRMVIGEQNEILRFIAGSIIRQLASQGVPQELFWPTEAGVALRTNFFQSQLDSSQWPELLEGYLDEMDSQLKNHEQKFTPFSYLLQLGSKAYSDTAPSFLVTLDGPLSIIIPELTTTSGTRKSSQYIDVPINNISKVDIQETLVKTPTSSSERYVKYAVVVHLVKTDDYTMFVNAAAQSYPFIRLAFDNRDVANTLRHLILGLQNDGMTDSDSLSALEKPLARIEPLEFDHQHEVSPSPVRQNIPSKIRGNWGHTDLADGFEPNDEMASMVGFSTKLSLAAPTANVNPILDKDTPLDGAVLPDEKRLRNGNHPRKHETETTAIVSQSGREKLQKGKAVRNREVEFSGILATQGTRSPLDTIATSSAQWRDGANAIDNAPELASQIQGLESTASPLSPHGEAGIGPPAKVETILLAESTQLRIVNGNLNTKPSATKAVEGISIASFPAQVTTSTANRKIQVPKVSQRLLNRDGEQLDPLGTDEEAIRPKKSSKSANGASMNDNGILDKKRSSKNKTIYSATSNKVDKRMDPVSHDAEPGASDAEDDVFALPDSPARPSKSSVKTKQKKPAAKKAKTTKSKTLSKPPKAKPALGAPMVPVLKKASPNERVLAPTKRAAVRESVVNIEALVGSDHGDIHQGLEYDDRVEENQLTAINNKKHSARVIESSTKQEAEGASKGLTSKPRTNQSSGTGISDKNTAIASKSKNPDPAMPRRQSTRRTVAINANDRVKSVETNANSVDLTAKLNPDGNSPESREHVRRSDKARQELEQSALKAGPSSLTKSPSSPQSKGENELEQSSVNQEMAPSKRLHPEEEVEFDDTTIKDQPNLLLKTSCHLSGRTIEQVGRNFQDSHHGQGADPDAILAPSVELRSPGRPVDLITTANMYHKSDEVKHQHFNHATDFTTGDDKISFSDTFLEQETEALMTRQSPQLQNLDVRPNPDAWRSSVANQGNTATSCHAAGLALVTTPTTMPPPITSTFPKTRIAQSSSTKVASDVRESKIAVLTHGGSTDSPQLQPVEIRTSAHSSGRTRSEQNYPTETKPTDRVQYANLDMKKPANHKGAEETGDGPINTVKTNLQKQKPYITGPFCKQHSTNTEDYICGVAVESTMSQPASKLIEISSGVEASSEEEFGLPQERPHTELNKEKVTGKRKSDGTAGSLAKKLKAPPTTEVPKSHTTPPEPAERSTGLNEIDVEATDDRVQRKTIIIGFDLNGPRNQGISSAHKPLAATQPLPPMAPVLGEIQPSSKKRKNIEEERSSDHSFGPQRANNAPIKKLRRTVTVVPPTPQATERASVLIHSPIRQPNPRLLSSQQSIVQENGSPVSTRSQLRRVNNVDIRHLMSHKVDDLNSDISMDLGFDRGFVKKMHCGHGCARGVEAPRKQHFTFQQQLPSIREEAEKILPSSPNATPWISADIANYYKQTSGDLVNFEMEDVVQVARISDPFGDMNQNQTNSFIEMLRATGGAGKGERKPKPEDIDFTLYEEGVKYIEPIDPDKTLVEFGRRRRPRHTPSSDGYSSSSHSSDSKGGKEPSKRSDSEEDEKRTKVEREWREALEQHQTKPLNSLHEMSNRLVKHLCSKESAINDMVADYTDGGTRLVEGLNEAHGGDRKMLVEKTRNAKQTLEAQLEGLTLGLEKASKGVRRQRVAEIQKISRFEEQKTQNELEVALGAYGN
ncbi:hypothetical protein MMC18_006590 [Xylographa bjoerkii]|nr:hypothetical protein [Xylographa bjoerkii]